MKPRIVDKAKTFLGFASEALNLALAKMAVDIERLSKEQVPHNKGQLKASGFGRKVGDLKYIVKYEKVYALYQHEGGDGKRVVQNYSKPGKKKHFLIDPATLIVAKAIEYLKRETDRVRV